MTGKQRVAVWGTAALSVSIVIGGLLFIIRHRPPGKPIVLTGVVLTRDSDPRKQLPIGDAEITATTALTTINTTSDASGYFHLTVPPQEGKLEAPELNFRRLGYLPFNVPVATGDQLYLIYMTPIPRRAAVPESRKESALTKSTVRVRYSEKAAVTTNTESLVKTFEVVNKGNIPCGKQDTCSPDGKWKAKIGSFTIEGQGREFRNVRLSCIGGPCPFTKVETQDLLDDGHNLKISVLNWSDTTTFLLEAEVTQTIQTDVIRQSYPAIFGSSMNFTLPATAEGPSVEAELNGQDIVFPLGPDLIVSWGVCTVKIGADRTKLFRCDLNPGYEFK